MKPSILAVFALALLGFSQAQIKGDCPNVINVQPNFDLNKFLGKWFEYANFDKGSKCAHAEYKLKGDGNLDYKLIMVDEITNVTSSMDGYAIPVENAKFKLIYSFSRPNNTTINYWILATDYKNYSVVYYCQPSKNKTYRSNAWIFTRQKVPTKTIVDIANEALAKNNISPDQLVVTNHSDC